MTGRYFYYEAGDLHFCRSATKSYGPCPFTGEMGRGIPPGWLQDVFDASDDPETRKLDAERIFVNAHRSTRWSEDPSRCGGCGAPRPAVGYAVWIEEPLPEGEYAMSFGEPVTHRRREGSLRYFPLRREAIAWCVENQAVERAALAESAG